MSWPQRRLFHQNVAPCRDHDRRALFWRIAMTHPARAATARCSKPRLDPALSAARRSQISRGRRHRRRRFAVVAYTHEVAPAATDGAAFWRVSAPQLASLVDAALRATTTCSSHSPDSTALTPAARREVRPLRRSPRLHATDGASSIRPQARARLLNYEGSSRSR